MDEKLRHRISSDQELLSRAGSFAELLEKADGTALMKAIRDNDEKGIANALGVSVGEARSIAQYFYDTAADAANYSPQLREAASYFGSECGSGARYGNKE